MRSEADTAFDLWLSRALRDRFGAVAAEPLPDGLLRLLRTPGGHHPEDPQERSAAWQDAT